MNVMLIMKVMLINLDMLEWTRIDILLWGWPDLSRILNLD
jgi:hypothetical protein